MVFKVAVLCLCLAVLVSARPKVEATTSVVDDTTTVASSNATTAEADVTTQEATTQAVTTRRPFTTPRRRVTTTLSPPTPNSCNIANIVQDAVVIPKAINMYLDWLVGDLVELEYGIFGCFDPFKYDNATCDIPAIAEIIYEIPISMAMLAFDLFNDVSTLAEDISACIV